MNDNVVCVIQAEKRKMLMEHETQKIKELEEQYSNELREWKAMLIPRKQVCREPTSNAFVGPSEMMLRLTNGWKLRNVLTHNIIWANEKTVF